MTEFGTPLLRLRAAAGNFRHQDTPMSHAFRSSLAPELSDCKTRNPGCWQEISDKKGLFSPAMYRRSGDAANCPNIPYSIFSERFNSPAGRKRTGRRWRISARCRHGSADHPPPPTGSEEAPMRVAELSPASHKWPEDVAQPLRLPRRDSSRRMAAGRAQDSTRVSSRQAESHGGWRRLSKQYYG